MPHRELNLEDVQELLLVKHGVLHPPDLSSGDAELTLADLIQTASHEKLEELITEIGTSIGLLELEKMTSRDNPFRGPHRADRLGILSRFLEELPREAVTH